MNFTDALKRIAFERGLKQADLSRMTGIDAALMSMYFNGKRTPSLTNAVYIADALQIPLDELAGRDQGKRVIEQRLLSDFRQLSDQGQEIAVSTVYGLRLSYPRKYVDASWSTEKDREEPLHAQAAG